MQRIDNAVDGELYAVTMNSPLNFTVELAVQDANRGHDWINIAFEVDGVTDARLVDDDKVSFIDMADGITIVFEEGECGLAVGKYNALASLKDAAFYLTGTSIKYEERPFKS